jgi:tetratricopeptide (TPR) repeat protein
MADLDRAVALSPGDVDARMAHGRTVLWDGRRDEATADAKAADAALAPTSDKRRGLASLYASLGDHDAAMRNFDRWFASHSRDGSYG